MLIDDADKSTSRFVDTKPGDVFSSHRLSSIVDSADIYLRADDADCGTAVNLRTGKISYDWANTDIVTIHSRATLTLEPKVRQETP